MSARPWVDLSTRGQRYEAREGAPAIRPRADENTARAKLAGYLVGLGAQFVPPVPACVWEPTWCPELLNETLRRRTKRAR